MAQGNGCFRFGIRVLALASVTTAVVAGIGATVDTTMEDFHLSGTQMLDVGTDVIEPSANCSLCHGYFDFENEPHATWQGSLMGLAGRDPLFFAQMTTANQDAAHVGYFCMRCHVPMSFVTGHAADPSGAALDESDREGVSCHFCHSMVDPIYKPGLSPAVDESILAAMDEVPGHYGNAMFVLDPQGRRRGPYSDPAAPHPFLYSPFHQSGEFCGTCHDVGNVAISRQPDGAYRYNALNQRTPDEDLHAQFPLERTYTEWKLSAFASGGVDMGGRFGGDGVTVVETCQDCHMPRTLAQGCFFGPTRSDLARHEFAGAAASVLDLIAELYPENGIVDPNAVAAGKERAISMLERAASLELDQRCGSLSARVINETGHKLPTGHIEGRRMWVSVRMYGPGDVLLREYGAYDANEAVLDEVSTRVYEMHVGLSEDAAAATGLPPGRTTHMALADEIVKDNRIPPRGFENASFEAGGAPVVAAAYADGQYWSDTFFAIPAGAERAEVEVYYQNLPRDYIEHLRDANGTDDWGQTLYGLWVSTGKGAPIRMVSGTLSLGPFFEGDLDCDGHVGIADLSQLLSAYGTRLDDPSYDGQADLTGDHAVGIADLSTLLTQFGRSCPQP
ncbi:MAG: hypothetical protein HRF50_09575 [Phycisphaerae bacterium]|jgi:hypothetical protein